MALEKIGISMFWSLRDRRARNTDRSLRLPRRTNDAAARGGYGTEAAREAAKIV